jgi:hypothetical protein
LEANLRLGVPARDGHGSRRPRPWVSTSGREETQFVGAGVVEGNLQVDHHPARAFRQRPLDGVREVLGDLLRGTVTSTSQTPRIRYAVIALLAVGRSRAVQSASSHVPPSGPHLCVSPRWCAGAPMPGSTSSELRSTRARHCDWSGDVGPPECVPAHRDARGMGSEAGTTSIKNLSQGPPPTRGQGGGRGPSL